MRRPTRILTIFLLLATPLAVSAEPPENFGWKGSRLGDEVSAETVDRLSCTSTEGESFLWCSDRVDLEDTWLSVNMRLDSNRFVYMQGEFPAKTWVFVREVFETKYGPPTAIQTETLHNAMGAVFVNEMLTWKRKEGALQLNQYGEDVERGSLAMMTHEELARRIADEQRKPKSAAKKF